MQTENNTMEGKTVRSVENEENGCRQKQRSATVTHSAKKFNQACHIDSPPCNTSQQYAYNPVPMNGHSYIMT